VQLIVAVVILVVLGAFMCTYSVRFTERAVVTTLGKATEGSVKVQPGLYLKAPPPFQSVTKYDSRVRVFTLKVETQQTMDNRQVAVETFCTWRVADPLKFFQNFSGGRERSEEHYARAESVLKANLRAAVGAVSTYTMEDLFTADSGKSKLPVLEGQMLAALRDAGQAGTATAPGTGRLADYGIEAVDVGLTRILLPEEVTKAVFDRMKSGRERIARETESRGQSEAQAIRDRADSDAKRIRAFAEQFAQSIRDMGDREATQYLAQMNANQELAVFLEKVKFLREVQPRTATLVFSTNMPGVDLLSPDTLNAGGAGGAWIGELMKSRTSPSPRAGGVMPNGAADIQTPAAGGRQ
jgi:membrane protease subunit HflC